jgi:CheY-like chemotaxis protein
MALAVFLVEDNPRIRESLIPALADLGSASVMATAESEDEAIAWLGRHKGQWDLAVVDFFLKQGSGLGVVTWCAGRDPGQRVVVLTNYAAPSTQSSTSPSSSRPSSTTVCRQRRTDCRARRVCGLRVRCACTHARAQRAGASFEASRRSDFCAAATTAKGKSDQDRHRG